MRWLCSGSVPINVLDKDMWRYYKGTARDMAGVTALAIVLAIVVGVVVASVESAVAERWVLWLDAICVGAGHRRRCGFFINRKRTVSIDRSNQGCNHSLRSWVTGQG